MNCGRCIRCLDEGWFEKSENELELAEMSLFEVLIKPSRRRLVVCQHCGNKRCPCATDHNLTCTNSNEPGQAGSRYA
jgi:hypothetical protein